MMSKEHKKGGGSNLPSQRDLAANPLNEKQIKTNKENKKPRNKKNENIYNHYIYIYTHTHNYKTRPRKGCSNLPSQRDLAANDPDCGLKKNKLQTEDESTAK